MPSRAASSPLLLATRNPGKTAELQRILTGWRVLSLADVPPYPEPVEDGASFAENAVLKARAALAATGLPAVADDSGLCVDALAGMPGIFSARWAGRHGDDRANLELLLGQLTDVPDARRGAAFVCAAAYADASGRELVVEARWAGRLIREPRGDNGFGYDPIFAPAGQDRTSAQLSAADKDAVSHRGQAFRRLAELLSASPPPQR